MRVANIANYKKSVLKAITNSNALAYTNQPLLVENLMLFGHFGVHFWSYEGSENGKQQKKVVLKGITKRNALAGTK